MKKLLTAVLAVLLLTAGTASAQSNTTLESLFSQVRSIADLMASLTESTGQVAQVIAPTSGLIGHWSFDEGAGTTAGDSAGANDGALTNGTSWTTGKAGTAISLDGNNDYVSLGNSTTLLPQNAMTVAGWFKTPDTSSFQAILARRGSVQSYYMRLESGKAAFSVNNGTFKTVRTNTSYPANTWVHVVGTWDGSQLKIYYNGVADATSVSQSGAIPTNSDTNYIGTRGSGSLNFNGSLDDARLYNRALSAQEVQDLYNATAGAGGSAPAADNTAPTVPTNLSASPLSFSQAALSWSASSDTNGIAGYKIYRDGSQVATVAGTAYSDNGLTANTTYTYTVAAYDAAGNTSAQSTAKTATTPNAVTTGGSGVFFKDNFETGGLVYTQNGAKWTGGAFTTVNTVNPKTGNYALEFRFPANKDGDDGFSEERFTLGSKYPDLWLQYDFFVPSNYTHRSQAHLGQSDNNKGFAFLWEGGDNKYGDPDGPSLGSNFWPNSDGSSRHTMSTFKPGYFNGHSQCSQNAIELSDRGQWIKITIHAKYANQGANDGEYELWKTYGNGNVVKVCDFKNQSWYVPGQGGFDTGYLMGWANSGFTQATKFYIDNVTFSSSPLSTGSTGGGTTPTQCTYTYSTWGSCQTNNTQTRAVLSSSPSGCTGTPVTTQSCTYQSQTGGSNTTPTQCAYTYSNWGSCSINNLQTRSVISSSPSGCSGNPVTLQSCTYTSSQAGGTTGVNSSSAGGSGGSSSGSSGGGGSSANTTDDPNRTALLARIAELQQLIATLTAQMNGTTPNSTYRFSKYVTIGDDDPDVLQMQKKLNRLGFTVSTEGPGAPGNETSYYGPLTTKAIERFQCQYNIVCSGEPWSTGYGNFGPQTREKLGSL